MNRPPENVSPASIPADRPVLGQDLETLRQRLNCSTQRCCCLLGIPMNLWSRWKNAPEEPIPNATVALTMRLYDCFPELLEPDPTPAELQALLERVTGQPVPLTMLSMLLGRERSSGYRWSTRGPPSAPVVNLIGLLVKLLEMHGAEAFATHQATVEAEARARGIEDIWTSGSWGAEV